MTPSPTIKLYQYPPFEGMPSMSPPCMKVQLVMRRMGLAFETVDLESPFAVKRYSPTGRVPAIEIDGARLCDSIAIVDRLFELFPDRAIGPKEPLGRVHDRLWDTFATDSLYWLTYYFRWVDEEGARGACDLIAQKKWLIGRVAMPLVVIPGMRKRASLQGVGGRPREEVIGALEQAVTTIETALGDGPFLEGKAEPGRGDIAVGVQLLALGYGGGIESAMAAVRARPAVLALPRRVFEACELEPPGWWPSA